MKSTRWLLLLLLIPALVAFGCGDDDDDDNDDATPTDDDTVDDDTVDDDDDDVTPDDDDTTPDDDDTTPDDDTTDDDTDPGDAIEPTQGFLDRQAEYLQACYDSNGGTHSQVCRVLLGATEYNETKIYEDIEEVLLRDDCADFGLNSLLRMLYLDRDRGVIPPQLKADIEDAVLGFKYWIDEPGDDEMCWWSENHQALFHAAELMAGQLFPEEIFDNSGMTGAEHVAKATELMNEWLDYRGLFGFSEWHSNVYFNEDMPAILNVVDFAEDPELATKAAMVMDAIGFDMLNNYYKGLFATAHGRTYQDKLLFGLNDSTDDPVWLLYGLGERHSSGNFSAAHLATSPHYWPPAILEDIAQETVDNHEHRQRDGINIDDGPDWGIGYEDWRDIMFWWGMTGYAAPKVVTGTFNMIEEFDMWDGFFWSDIAFLRIFVGTPIPEMVTSAVPQMSLGAALQTMSTYTWRTPHYQLSGMQDYAAGMWTGQVHVWQATLDADAYVFTTAPGGLEDDYMAGEWTGGWTPRSLLHENVAILQYDRKRIPLLEQLLFAQYTHAYFPKNEFDEFVEDGHWVIGRKGDAYVALYSEHDTYWSSETGFEDVELIADGIQNVWICELGSADEYADFDAFVNAITSATVSFGEPASYDSPSQGLMTFSMQGPLIVDGVEIDTGPYGRWDNAYVTQEFGTQRTIIEQGTQRLDLDFENVRRRYWENYSSR